jgi:hypothetical protein
VGAVAGQLLNGARACLRDLAPALEQEQLIDRLEKLEEALKAHQQKAPPRNVA